MKGAIKFAPGEHIGLPWPERRKIYALILRTARALRRVRFEAGQPFDWGMFFAGARVALMAQESDWWHWADDAAANRSPLDFTPEARHGRRCERIARFRRGEGIADIVTCHCGGTLPYPAAEEIERARQQLAGEEK